MLWGKEEEGNEKGMKKKKENIKKELERNVRIFQPTKQSTPFLLSTHVRT